MNLDLTGCKSKHGIYQTLWHCVTLSHRVQRCCSESFTTSSPTLTFLPIHPTGSLVWDGTKICGQIPSIPLLSVPLIFIDPVLIEQLQDDLDSEFLLKGRRIYLDRVDGHAAWVSNRVLQLMGDLPNEVDGGLIIRDPSGKPTGKTHHISVD